MLLTKDYGSYNDDYTQKTKVQDLVFSADLITANKINGTVNGTALTETTYATSNLATLAVIAAKIDAVSGIASAVSDSSHTITVTVEQSATNTLALTSFAVTEGVSQATATVSTKTVYSYLPSVTNKRYIFRGVDGHNDSEAYIRIYDGTTKRKEFKGALDATQIVNFVGTPSQALIAELTPVSGYISEYFMTLSGEPV